MKRHIVLFIWLGIATPFLMVGSLLSAPSATVLSALPPLPTMTPRSEATGAAIALRVKPTDVKMWTVVQWQDGEGGWHTVDGWRGELDLVAKAEGWKWWFFGRDLLGRGPFRWLVYTANGRELLATSEPFDMPDSLGETVTVDVFLLE